MVEDNIHSFEKYIYNSAYYSNWSFKECRIHAIQYQKNSGSMKAEDERLCKNGTDIDILDA